MKRVWFAAVFIAISISLCIGEQMYVEQVYNGLNNEISKAEQCESYEDLEAAISGIQTYWKKNNDLLFTIADHGVLDELGTGIRSLDAYDDDIEGTLSELKAVNKVFYENQKITMANIF